ncbi:hypothetical protein [Thermosynechococcus sp.]
MSGRSWGREFWRWLWLEKSQVDQWFGYQAERKLASFMQTSARVLVLRQQDADWLLTFLPPERVA